MINISKTTETPIERKSIKDHYEKEIDRLRTWLRIIKNHTLDGSILALIDLALDNKCPLSNDLKKDNAHDYNEVWGPNAKNSCKHP